MTKLIGIIFTFLSAFSLLAQDSQDPWITYKTTDNVTIKYQYFECNNKSQGTFKEYVIFKIQNHNDFQIEISWQFDLWYDKENYSKKNPREFEKSLFLKPNETFMSSCGSNREYNIFSKFLNYENKELTKFELLNIKVEKRK